MKTNQERFAAIKSDPGKYEAYKTAMRAAWRRYAAKNAVYERRAEKYFRHRSRKKTEEQQIRFAGLQIVTAKQIAQDETTFHEKRLRLRSPQRTRCENALVKLANAILAGKKTAAEAEAECQEILKTFREEKCPPKKSGTSTSPKRTPKPIPTSSAKS